VQCGAVEKCAVLCNAITFGKAKSSPVRLQPQVSKSAVGREVGSQPAEPASRPAQQEGPSSQPGQRGAAPARVLKGLEL